MSCFKIILIIGACIGLSQGAAFDLTVCGKTKGCFFPDGCNNDNSCPSFVTYADDGNGGIHIEMARTGSGWIGFGLNDKLAMDGALVLECKRTPSGTISIGLSYNSGYSNSQLTDANVKAGITNEETEFSSNKVRCSFTWLKTASTLATGPDASKIPPVTDTAKFYLLQAFGDVAADGTKMQHSNKYATSTKLSLTDTVSAVGLTTVATLVRLHGSLMVAAWILFVSIGITLARYYKDVWPSTKVCSKPVWFTFHRMCMVTTFLLTVAGIVVIFVEKQEWSELDAESPTILKYHPIFGIIVTVLACTNPTMALFRPHPGTPRRPIFNWAHWAVGTCAHILGVLTVFAGLNLSVTETIAPGWLTWLLVGFVAFHILVDFTLEIHRCKLNNARLNEDIPMKDLNTPGADDEPQPRGQVLRKVIISVYIIVAVSVATVIIVMLFTQGDYP